jgi:membrane-associated phospholipid phosphatase
MHGWGPSRITSSRPPAASPRVASQQTGGVPSHNAACLPLLFLDSSAPSTGKTTGAGLLALGLFATLALAVLDRQTMSLDQAVLAWLTQLRSPGLDLIARGASLLGSAGVALVVVVLVLLFGYWRRWGPVLWLLLGVGGAQLLTEHLKELFHRPRPTPPLGLVADQDFSFPSGQATVATALAFCLAYLGWGAVRGRRRALLVVGLAVVVLTIGLARLYLGAHYPTDVLAGYLAGFAWADAVIMGSHWLARSAHRVRPVETRIPPGEG